MKRTKKPRQKRYQDPQQKQAIKYLSLISEKETGYLQDWAIINEIKQHDIQSSQEMNNQRQEQRKQQNTQRNGIVLRVMKKRLNKSRGRECGSLVQDGNKKEIQVRVEDFATIPNCRAIIKQRKSQLDMYKSNENFHSLHNSHQQQNQQHENVIKIIDNETEEKLRQSKSLNYIDKIRKLSLPWVKQLPRQCKKQDSAIEQSIKARQESRRLNQLIKNKIRRKQSNKFIVQRQQQQRQSNDKINKDSETNMNQTQNQHKNIENVEQILQNNQIKILRNWLDNNRSKRKRSITSLLNQHFEFKYLEKKKNREKAMAMKSLKAIATMSHYNHMG